jgi:hypothetical protein
MNINQEIEERLREIVRSELARAPNRSDPWHSRKSAPSYVQLSVGHFNRLDVEGVFEGHGEGRMRRWRQSALDRGLENLNNPKHGNKRR